MSPYVTPWSVWSPLFSVQPGLTGDTGLDHHSHFMWLLGDAQRPQQG